MRDALGASLSAEKNVFQDRLAKAEARLGPARIDGSGMEDPQMDANGTGENKLRESGGVKSPLQNSANTGAVAPARVVREAFTIPESEHGQIEEVRSRLLGQAVAVSKSEILRAGLSLLYQLDDQELVVTVEKLDRVKTGRPKTI
jgi:hypothetical protein